MGAFDQFRELLAAAQKLVDLRPIGVNTRSPERILSDGRFRSAFETKSWPAEAVGPAERRQIEEELLGIPRRGVPNEQRPIYGALRQVGSYPTQYVGEAAPRWSAPDIQPNIASDMYGPWLFLLNQDAKKRSIGTFGDSALVGREGSFDFNSRLNPRVAEHLVEELGLRDKPTEVAAQYLRNFNPGVFELYPETMTRGPVSINDVRALVAPDVRFLSKRDQDADRISVVRRLAQDRNIPFYGEDDILRSPELQQQLQLKAHGGLVERLRAC